MLNVLDRLLKWCCGLVAALALFSLMCVTVVDVTGRKFDRPLAGGLELTEILMVMVIFSVIPLVSWRGEHVVFDTLDAYTSDTVKRWQRRLVHLLSAATFLLTAHIMMIRASRFADYGDVTEHFRVPIAPVAQFMAASLALAAVIHLILALFRPDGLSHAMVEHQEAQHD